MIVPIGVECYAGWRAEQEPRVVHLETGSYRVRQVVDRWYEGGLEPTDPGADYFKIELESSGIVLIKRDHSLNAWFLLTEARR